MNLADLAKRSTEWLRGTGQMSDVVISSRVRLARNLAGMPFLGRCSPEQQTEIEQRLRDCIIGSGVADPGGLSWVWWILAGVSIALIWMF